MLTSNPEILLKQKFSSSKGNISLYYTKKVKTQAGAGIVAQQDAHFPCQHPKWECQCKSLPHAYGAAF